MLPFVVYKWIIAVGRKKKKKDHSQIKIQLCKYYIKLHKNLNSKAVCGPGKTEEKAIITDLLLSFVFSC